MTVDRRHYETQCQKRKYSEDSTIDYPFQSHYEQISPRIVKKLRPKTINPDILKGKPP